MISNYKSLTKIYFPQLFAFFLLLLLLLIGSVPGYFSGNWEWQEPPSVTNLKEVKQIRETGLKLSGWETVETVERQVGGQKWLSQKIKQKGSDKISYLLLLPQNGPRNQPQVEWTEVKGFWQWNIAQFQTVKFTVKPSSTQNSNTTNKVEANFFRAVFKNRQTYAVLQWYAMPDGGTPSPLKWFFADQIAQLSKQRIPWVAVNIMIPIEPLGEVKKSWSIAKSLGEQVQASLVLNSFQR